MTYVPERKKNYIILITVFMSADAKSFFSDFSFFSHKNLHVFWGLVNGGVSSLKRCLISLRSSSNKSVFRFTLKRVSLQDRIVGGGSSSIFKRIISGFFTFKSETGRFQ